MTGLVGNGMSVLVAGCFHPRAECGRTALKCRRQSSITVRAPPLAGTVTAPKWLIDGLSPVSDGSAAEGVLDRARDAMPAL